MKQTLYFLLTGFAIAFFEEFITQGVLKGTIVGWIAPTVVAFIPFLLVNRAVYNFLIKRLREPQALLDYYVVAGLLGLLVEWFLIGLVPWGGGDPILIIILQLGMFSFWGSVAFLPLILLDKRKQVADVKRWTRRFYIGAMIVVYLATFTVPKDVQFIAGVGTVILTFVSLNIFYFLYLRALEKKK